MTTRWRRLHWPDGSHRTTPPSTRGRDLERHEALLRRHLEKVDGGPCLPPEADQ